MAYTLLLIDSNSILNRAYYGIRPLTTSDGLFTHAVYGMNNIILKHLDALKPDFAAAAFDLRAPTFRHKLYDGYKANRKGMPEELAVQLPWAKKCVEGLGIKIEELSGYEADDVIGTLALGAPEDTAVYILTGDRDSFQLIRDNVTVLLASTGETVNMDRAAFNAKYGVQPEQFVDVKALMGDSSDNIPGVSGIGEKTALKLISDFSTLEGVYENIDSDKITKGNRTKLENGRDNAFLSRTLAKIDTSVPLTDTDVRYNGIKRAELKEVFTRLELSALIKRLGLDKSEPADNEGAENTGAAFEYERLTPGELSEKASDGLYAVSGLEALDGNAGGYVRIYGSSGGFEAEFGLSEASQLLSGGRKACVYDSKALYRIYGGHIGAELFDVLLAAYVLNPADSKYDLSRLALTYLNRTVPDGCDPAPILYELMPIMEEKLKATGQYELYENIELPLAKVLAEMELAGFKVDREGLKDFSEKLGVMCDEYAKAVYFAAGETFNLNSPKQLGEVLFEKLGLPHRKKNKSGGYSTDAETLEELRPYSAVVDNLLEYRTAAKLKSTYSDGLYKVADENGRIHTTFNQTVTATGRLSSAEPNLQNIPIRQPLGRELRRFFIPENENYVFVDADYSQIELRVLAAIADDEHMIQSFLDGEDIHTRTAAQVFGVPFEAVTPEQRKRAKAVNFGIVYGISDYSLARDIGVYKREAAEYIKNYLDNYPGVRDYLKNVVENAKRDGYVTTMFGRRRYIPELSSPKKTVRSFGERVAMNSPIQGAAADIIKIAMINVSKALKESGIDARLILQVHDELIVEANVNCAEQASEILRTEMEGAAKLSVPLAVDIGMGKTWYDC